MIPSTLEWTGSGLRILDQRALPDRVVFLDCSSVAEVVDAIRTLAVRGAPAIGIAAAYGVVLGAMDGREELSEVVKRLASSRPTAVNLFWALDRMTAFAKRCQGRPHDRWIESLLQEAGAIHREDVENNRRLGAFGQALLPRSATVLTHCNAGALATGGYGTALGVIRAAREAGKEIKIYADETRPLLQGARLTAWELAEDGFDVTLICDSMAACLMRSGCIDAVIVGADRIAANGDVANKIGTYGLAVLASHHAVPFYVAAPCSTFDTASESGESIPIEERSAEEMRVLPSGRSIPESIPVWNPAFDVTPARLVDAIITERGLFRPPYRFLETAEGVMRA